MIYSIRKEGNKFFAKSETTPEQEVPGWLVAKYNLGVRYYFTGAETFPVDIKEIICNTEDGSYFG